MVLDPFERYFIYDTFQNNLQQDMLTNALFNGSSVGASLREMVLGQQPVQPLTNPFDEAITGTLRADAAAVRQNAKNVGEAAAMVGIAHTAASQISDLLAGMEEIIDKINEGELSGSSATVQADYNSMRDEIIGIMQGTDYNGIYLLDSTKWDTDQIDSNGNVYIQGLKNGGFNVTFHNLNSINWSQLTGADLAAAGTRATQLSLVESFSSTIDTIQDVYSKKQTSLEYHQTQLDAQAGLLDQAAAVRRQFTTESAEDALLDLILSGSGTLLDETG